MIDKLKNRWVNRTPAQTLFFLSPVLGELVSSYLSPLEFFNPIIFLITIFPYGCGALIVRELLVRYHKGWISLVLLGLAFGLFFEGIVTGVLFNPNWEDSGALGEYSHIHGFNWVMAVGIVHFHAAISIICAVLLAEIIYPEPRGESWISTRALIRCCLLLPAWTAVISLLSGYHAPLLGGLLLIGVVAALIALALLIPAEPLRPRRIASPAVFAGIGGIGMTLIMIGTYMVPEMDTRPPMMVSFVGLLALVIGEFAAITVFNSGGTTWTDRHRLALVIGFLVFFLAFGFLQDLEGFRGRFLVSVAAIWHFRRLWLHVGQKEPVNKSEGKMSGERRGKRSEHYWRNLSLTLGGAGLAAILVLFAFLVYLIIDYAARSLEPPRRPIDCNPADREITDYQEISLTTEDDIVLRGWYIPAQHGAVIILAHGYAGTRCDLLPEAEILSGAGYGVLLFDLRGHGISGGDQVTFGDRERRDMAAALDFVQAQPGVDPDRIGALGFSMGGVITIETAARDSRIKAVVVEAAFADLQETVRYRARLLGPLSKNLAVWSVKHQGVDLDAVRPADALCDISPRPVLLIYGDQDQEIPPGDAAEMIGAVCDPAETWLIHGAGHGNYPAVVGDEYAVRLVVFFEAALFDRNNVE